jgi:hypothetical protein
MSSNAVESICKVVSIATLVNLVAFVALAGYFGGDAINGHEVGGHYFLGMKGSLIEVSQSVFVYSKWHTLSLFVTSQLRDPDGYNCMANDYNTQSVMVRTL